MTYKSIYLALSGDSDAKAAADAAFVLAKAFDARLVASDTVAEPGPFLDQTGIGMMATYYDELYKTAEKVLAHKRSTASDVFEAARQRHDVPLKSAAGASATCHWHAHDGDAAIVARLGRLADVIVLACPGERGSYADLKTFEQAVFDARRPIVMVPSGTELNLDKPAVIAWNGSAEAARAVINATPLLAKSGRAHVVQVGELDADGAELSEAEAYLALYGVKIDTETVKAGKQSVADVISARVEKTGAGYCVMGAYTHNPWRELVLGGMTQHMLKHAGVPILIAH